MKKKSKFQKTFDKVAVKIRKAKRWDLQDKLYANKDDYKYFYNLGLQAGRREKK